MEQIDPKSHLCSICNKSFARPSKLQYHIAFHHEKKVIEIILVEKQRKMIFLSSSSLLNVLNVVNHIPIKIMWIVIIVMFIKKKIRKERSMSSSFLVLCTFIINNSDLFVLSLIARKCLLINRTLIDMFESLMRQTNRSLFE